MRQKQIEESKDLIMNGFFSLLNQKEYKKISMTEIAESAMVTRMTLYRHFKNKEEIIKYLIMNLVQSIKNRYIETEDKTIERLIGIRNEEISKSKYLNIVLSNKDVETLIKEFITSARNMFNEYIGVNSFNDDYLYSFTIGGIEAVTTKWILGGMKESPDIITKETIKILKLMDLSMEVES